MRPTLLVGAVGVAALAGCLDPVRAEDQIAITVGASRSVVTPADTVVLAAALFNGSSSTLAIGRPCGRPFAFQLLDSAGAVVLDTNGADYPCAADTTTTTIAVGPSQTLTSNIRLVGLASKGTPLPAGQYLLQATVVVAGTTRRSPFVRLLVPPAGTT